VSAAASRRLLHAAHALASLVLLATGFLLEFPDLRARVVGGYGLWISNVHLWSGAAFAAAPVLALAATARPLWRDLRRRLGPPGPRGWRELHIVLSLASAFLLAVSGLVLWVAQDLPLPLEDACLEVHLIFTWVLAISLPLHLVAARAKIAAFFRGRSGPSAAVGAAAGSLPAGDPLELPEGDPLEDGEGW